MANALPWEQVRLTLGAAKAEALLSKIFDLLCKIGFARNLLIFQAT